MISKNQFVSLAILIHLTSASIAFAEASYELSCRHKAKEIAAETYKNCVTTERETQLQQIRGEYKDKLAELKSHYDKELKKLSNKSSQASVTQAKSNEPKATQQKSMRASGARQLPKKAFKTEVIDLTSPAESNDEENLVTSQNRLKSESESISDSEIVELPTQE